MDRMANKLHDLSRHRLIQFIRGGSTGVQKMDRKAKRGTKGQYIYYSRQAQRAQSGVHRTPRGGESRMMNTG